MPHTTHQHSETEIAASLSAYFKLRNKPLVSPKLNNQTVTLTKLFVQVEQLGGHDVCNWESCAMSILNDGIHGPELKQLYEHHLLAFEKSLAAEDPIDTFYNSDTFKVKSYKPFDGNMIYDRCSPMPLKELNQFLTSRNFGFSTLMHDRLSSMLRAGNDPGKMTVMQDLGLIDMLTIIKMLESQIFDEMRQAITIINVCTLDTQLDFYFIENPELYQVVFHVFKNCVGHLIALKSHLFEPKINNSAWQSDSYRLLELAHMLLKTFTNLCHRTEIHNYLLKLDLLDVTLAYSQFLIAFLSTFSTDSFSFDLNTKHHYDFPHKSLSTENLRLNLESLNIVIQTLHLISGIQSLLGNTLVHPIHRMSDIFSLLSFTQLGFKNWLLGFNEFETNVFVNYLEEIQLNCCFLLGNIFILHENSKLFLGHLQKSDKLRLQVVLAALVQPLISVDATNKENETKYYMILHSVYRLTTKEVFKGMTWDPILMIQGVIAWMLVNDTIQEKGFTMIRNIVPYYKMKSLENEKMLDSWEKIQSWVMEMVGDLRIVKRKMAVQLLQQINK